MYSAALVILVPCVYINGIAAARAAAWRYKWDLWVDSVREWSRMLAAMRSTTTLYIENPGRCLSQLLSYRWLMCIEEKSSSILGKNGALSSGEPGKRNAAIWTRTDNQTKCPDS